MGKMEKHMRDWVQRRDVQRAAASAFNAHLDKQGHTVSHDFAWHLDPGIFDGVEKPITKAEAIRLLSDTMLIGFARYMKPQGSG